MTTLAGRISAIAVAAAFACGASAPAALAQAAGQRPTVAQSAPVTYTGTVTQIDDGTRLVTTRGADGQISRFEVPPSLPESELGQLRVGDRVNVTYLDGVDIRRKPAGEPPLQGAVDPNTGLRTATVTINAVDAAAGTITFVGPRGRYTRALGAWHDPALLGLIAPGDRVDMVYAEYVQGIALVSDAGFAAADPARMAPPPPAMPVVPVPSPMAPVPAPDDFRHRFTISGLWGWDNQFTGKMIAAGAGNVNGVPIVFEETTFDEVYGRMGLFKVGVGYRISPRSEVTVNLVLSDSASEPVIVGAVGTQGAPVTASFDDYSYWGVEVGQRFYFARVRFTPFVGYYGGVNRFTKINGDFVAVGSEGLLAVQDGQFFDASWALSFGGIGGVLIGLGPFEVMAQAELRYMGGLSDVDPLSQAGLKDLNAESSRWSLPILFGARIRF
jgi:hypothetical protein